MKNFLRVFIGVALATNFIACTSQSGKAPKLATNMDTVSYAIGIWIGNGPANVADKDQIDPKLVVKGLVDAFEENENALSMQEVQMILNKFSQDQQTKQAELDKASEAERVQAGIDFLAENKTKEGVMVTESGLQYRVIKEGEGNMPVPTDKVKVHYEGRLIDGDVFDSSKERGIPAEFTLNQVIPGWTEGLQLMKEGAVYEFYIPSDLAYGQRAAGEKIKPNSTLVFEVELIEILDQEVKPVEEVIK